MTTTGYPPAARYPPTTGYPPTMGYPHNQMFQPQYAPPPQTRNVKVPYFASVIFGIIMAALMIYWSSRFQGGYTWSGSIFYVFEVWNLHATLTMFGFSIFLAESILVFRINRSSSKIPHVLMNFIGLVLTTVGLAAMFYLDNSIIYDQFFSFHSWIGIITYILFVGQFACGILTHLIPVLPKSLNSYHRACGIGIYILAIASVATGIILKATITARNYLWLDGESAVINFMGLAFIIFSMLVLYMVINPQYNRAPLQRN